MFLAIFPLSFILKEFVVIVIASCPWKKKYHTFHSSLVVFEIYVYKKMSKMPTNMLLTRIPIFPLPGIFWPWLFTDLFCYSFGKAKTIFIKITPHPLSMNQVSSLSIIQYRSIIR